MLRGLTTTTFFADDLDAASAWYSEFFGLQPYFRVPGGYIEWRLGDYQHEFGIVATAHAPHDVHRGPAGAVTYWAVDDLQATLDRLTALGARPHHPPTVRGEGFVTASVVDPFGNVLGVMTNAHYFDVLGKRA
ncbi:VOC family protein [Saccharothrix longispora]|uniref:VOC family protein n=1 Tax=Saccharothrix longispora TaxID=33920 RepID=UPI0028FD014A|nr:VOC family protein [Saccharothrix longispora]MDU0294987.1 VOC family protein [Saccharothrix longispora]